MAGRFVQPLPKRGGVLARAQREKEKREAEQARIAAGGKVALVINNDQTMFQGLVGHGVQHMKGGDSLLFGPACIYTASLLHRDNRSHEQMSRSLFTAYSRSSSDIEGMKETIYGMSVLHFDPHSLSGRCETAFKANTKLQPSVADTATLAMACWIVGIFDPVQQFSPKLIRAFHEGQLTQMQEGQVIGILNLATIYKHIVHQKAGGEQDSQKTKTLVVIDQAACHKLISGETFANALADVVRSDMETQMVTQHDNHNAHNALVRWQVPPHAPDDICEVMGKFVIDFEWAYNKAKRSREQELQEAEADLADLFGKHMSLL